MKHFSLYCDSLQLKHENTLNYLLFNLAVTDMMIGVFSIPMIVFGFIFNEAESTAAMLLCKFIAHGTLIFPSFFS